jgi:hypothetical protein
MQLTHELLPQPGEYPLMIINVGVAPKREKAFHNLPKIRITLLPTVEAILSKTFWALRENSENCQLAET